MTTQEESLIKKGIKEAIEKCGGFWSVVPEGTYGKQGDPDIIMCYKGWYVGIEAKKPSGKQSPIQKARQDQIEAAGGIYIKPRTVEEV